MKNTSPSPFDILSKSTFNKGLLKNKLELQKKLLLNTKKSKVVRTKNVRPINKRENNG